MCGKQENFMVLSLCILPSSLSFKINIFNTYFLRRRQEVAYLISISLFWIELKGCSKNQNSEVFFSPKGMTAVQAEIGFSS